MEAGYNESQFSNKLGVDRALLNRVINEKEKPSLLLTLKISKLLNVDSRIVFKDGKVKFWLAV